MLLRFPRFSHHSANDDGSEETEARRKDRSGESPEWRRLIGRRCVPATEEMAEGESVSACVCERGGGKGTTKVVTTTSGNGDLNNDEGNE
ncbi:hypothetical protein E2542_SST11966 [Spatholobus suberectus]|nr:hypothetical protein E2542_SST11966 [Spatholobus suberectus]